MSFLASFRNISRQSVAAVCPKHLFHGTLRNSSLFVGCKASLSKAFTAEEVKQYASICQDNNPIYMDEVYASKTKFGRPIVHAVLNVGLAITVMGTKLPGHGTILLNYDVNYPEPLYVGENVTAEVEMIKLVKRIGTFTIRCITDDGKITSQGTVTLLAPKESVPN